MDWRQFARQVVPAGAVGILAALVVLVVRAWVTR